MIELSELQDAAQKAFPADALRPDRDASWGLIAEMGWLMVPLAEEDGGLGLGRDAAAMLHYEMGRVLSRAPLIPALAALQSVAASAHLADRQGWIERLTAGELVTLDLMLSPIEAEGHVLSGTLIAVPDADIATHVLVTAFGLVALVPLDAPGVTVTETPLWDESRRLFEVRLDRHIVDPALIVGETPDWLAHVGLLREELLVALAAEALGGAAATLDLTVEYLKTRRQFDRPLAMFQALKHRCADLRTRIAAAEALLWARAADADADAVSLGAMKALACEVYRFTTEEAIQLHGGIGLTEEHPCHLYMKRAQLDCWLGGSADELNEAAGRAVLAGA